VLAAHERRARINAEVTGRLTDSLAGIRVVKAYQGEAREAVAFAAGARELLQTSLAATQAWLRLNVFTLS
jgi:subfamily B ATP-binding cassette protein MsbA